ncbi:toprim domain-containing protein [Hymenobacter sp. HSC-4F20]|uniref:toprim domain-containing protein n=1 Tax=Hymenobacter sp. HSC-4F20 TaxID=2864135 RepID=UPI001C72DC98|nr:toprim domain-containing protein [Hymenobacter sp. HSC-4F20]MBX0293201.1 toprim domain-containing protein [Hymenobacter sp. HSC-4F20]
MRSSSSLAAAKRFPILSLLTLLNIPVVSVAAGQEHYCLSPFRQESTPSFVVNPRKNVWIDFGETDAAGRPAGGDVLALLMRYFRVTLPQARLLLRELAGQSVPAPTLPPLEPQPAGAAFQEVSLSPLSYAPLVQYLRERGIRWELVQRNPHVLGRLQQVFYRPVGSARSRPYFALAWRSDAGGWELRSKNFQSCLGPKGLSYLPGREPGCALFEGFFDYLSALTHFGCVSFRCSVLILNSVSMSAQALPYLEAAPVVYSFLDNDAAGRKTLAFFEHHLPGRVQAQNHLYQGYKDVNDFLTRTPPTRPLPAPEPQAHPRRATARWWLWVVFETPDPTPRHCTFYSYSNDAAGYQALVQLCQRLQPQLRYYRLCERTQGLEFRVVARPGSFLPALPTHAS